MHKFSFITHTLLFRDLPRHSALPITDHRLLFLCLSLFLSFAFLLSFLPCLPPSLMPSPDPIFPLLWTESVSLQRGCLPGIMEMLKNSVVRGEANSEWGSSVSPVPRRHPPYAGHLQAWGGEQGTGGPETQGNLVASCCLLCALRQGLRTFSGGAGSMGECQADTVLPQRGRKTPLKTTWDPSHPLPPHGHPAHTWAQQSKYQHAFWIHLALLKLLPCVFGLVHERISRTLEMLVGNLEFPDRPGCEITSQL